MSRRGGGRRQDFRRHQQSSSQFPSFQRGGGGRGGRDGGGRASRGFNPAATVTQSAPTISRSSSSAFPPPTTSVAQRTTAPQSVASSSRASSSQATVMSSAAVEELRREVEQKLTTGDKVTKAETLPASSKAVRFTPRPGFGTAGKKCVVKANHFLVEIADRDLCHYDVKFHNTYINISITIDILCHSLFTRSRIRFFYLNSLTVDGYFNWKVFIDIFSTFSRLSFSFSFSLNEYLILLLAIG